VALTDGLKLPIPELTEGADGPAAFGSLANAVEDYAYDRILPTGVTRWPGHHWGSVTTLPTGTSVKRGDTAWYATYNVLVAYDGTNWRQAEIPVVAIGGTGVADPAIAGFYDGQLRHHATYGLQVWVQASTTWRTTSDRTIGDATGGGSGILAGTPTWSDLITITGTSGGGPVVARWFGSVANGSSGADRTASFRVILDGTQISTGSSNTGFTVPIGANANGHPRVPRAGADTSTPTAGTHTWVFQAQASINNAVVIESSALTIVETRA
jgi:hypothetical protein